MLQSELLDRQLFPTPEAADEALTRFAVYYSYQRLNGAIGWQTPAERWDGTPFTDNGFEHVPARCPTRHAWLHGLPMGSRARDRDRPSWPSGPPGS